MAPFLNEKDEAKELSHAEAVDTYLGASPVKLEMTRELTQVPGSLGAMELLVPALQFHDRWYQVTEDDFERPFVVSENESAHGQVFAYSSNVTAGKAGQYTEKANRGITKGIDSGKTREELVEGTERIGDLERTVALCREEGVSPVFVKMPDSGWGDADHDWGAALAEEFDVPFIDMCLPEIWDELGLSYDTDFMDGVHVNMLGSLKVTDYLGRFLCENYDLDDARGNPASGFADEDLRRFDEAVEDAGLCQCTDLGEYLHLIDRERYTVFIAVKGESAAGLDDALRTELKDLGADGLAALKQGESYAGVIDGGALVKEEVGRKGKEVSLLVSYEHGAVNADARSMQPGAVLDAPVTVSSTGAEGTAQASVEVDSADLCENKRGINFVVYNRETQKLVDTSSFDTHAGCARTSDLAK